MTDIIWGNGANVLSSDTFVLNVTHRKNGNSENYSDAEKIRITDADIPGLPHERADWDEISLKTCVNDAFLKCEIEQRDDSGILSAKVSHSGVGGY